MALSWERYVDTFMLFVFDFKIFLARQPIFKIVGWFMFDVLHLTLA